MSGESPYAPPETISAGIPDAPESYGWRLEGKRVWVEGLAQFPMIDPYSGAAEEVMTMNRLTLRYLPYWMTAVRWAFICTLLLPLSDAFERDVMSSFVFVGFLGLVASLIRSSFLPLTGIKVFFTARTLRIRSIQQWIVNGCFLIAFVSGWKLRPLEQIIDRHHLDLVSSVALGLWILGLIWMYLFRRKLTCRRHENGRFEIRGFHPKALELLAREQQAQAQEPLRPSE